MFVRMAAYREVGGLDMRFFMYSEEIEWCWRCRNAGWQVWIEPRATVVHLGGASSARDDLRRRSALYRSRVGLRRRMSGPAASLLLWCGMTVGLASRIAVRAVVSAIARRSFGKQSARSDWLLLRDIARSDPLARWAVS
jgi:GT2 family glycosyltransferase